jgi:hypothetical protein
MQLPGVGGIREGGWRSALAAIALLAATQPAAASPIALGDLKLNGAAQLVSPNLLRLTPNFDTNIGGDDPPAGSAWTRSRFDVADAWSASFDFHMWDPNLNQQLDNDGSGGDGIAFLIQNDPLSGTAALGRGAGGMGFLGIYDSVAVMFDTYRNNAAYGDPNGNYIAVNTRGADFNVPHHFCTNGELTTDPALIDLPGVHCTADPGLGMTTLIPRLDGPVHSALIAYVPGTMNVYLDSALVLSIALNLASTLNLEHGTDAFLGFTAGNRFSYQNHDIVDFSIAAVPEPGTLALVAIGGGLGLARRRRRRT